MYSKKLKEIRTEKKLYQKQLASILDISEISYTNYENEYYIMPTKYLIEVCNYLDISIDYLFELSDKKNYSTSKNNTDNKLPSKRLKEFRKENKITQDKLATILNCSYGTIAGYESGRYLIATPFLFEICKKYNISADYLLGIIDEPKYLKNN